MLSNQHLHVTEVELDTRVDTSVFPGRVGVAPNCTVGLSGQEGEEMLNLGMQTVHGEDE